VAIGAVALVLAVSALRQEQIPYPYNLKEPDSVAQAREMLLSHPARASSHFALLRLLEDKVPLDWQMSEAGIALWLDPSNPYLRDLYASILLRLGKTDQGLSEITQSVFNSPSLSTHFYLRENLLPWLSTGEQKAVEEGFKEALARGYPQALGDFAVFYARLDRFSDQGMLYEQAAAKESDGQKKAEVMINSGLAYAKAGQENKAERLFRDVIKTLPNDPRAYQHLVTAIYGVKKDLAGAQEIVSYGIKNGVPPFSLYLALAQAAQQAGRPDEVKASLQSAKTEVERSANNGEDPYPRYLLLADAARGAGDREQEIAVLVQALELRPRSSDTLFRLAGVYMQENNFDRAALYYSKIANINPNSPDVYYSLAVAEEGRYRFAEADKAYARAVELAPENDNYRQRYESFRGRVEQNRKKQEAGSMEHGAGSTAQEEKLLLRGAGEK
jgi:tetratricopeptide (TPR) repeat protein